ncbi:translation initiation factor IF-5A [Candidatus Woesearchaeota archaeon]|nr:translation initiation factor IF-5A [Candidatus Woesearchaeota archaeon]MBT5272360.1 translation initiation factor IF-5A [Candidatus Woesearchaeota archaeon]MBT6040589.1 translation initiation factor IF-5A [Candidatus Woesearchaeota archaeon]MBT6336632.1 translation initiation factor IF-5A [Candidatus Woesearchaeota archaeon]MBT7927522.1 translation initiation factor IF-5A [Candidatus Woesearchaeota archaeon]
MGETKLASVGSLNKGNYVVVDGAACKVSDTQISRPGKHGHAKVRLSAVGLLDGKKRVIVMPGHDNIEVPIIDKRTAQVLSISGKTANVMDAENYETFDLEIPDDLKTGCVEGCNILFWVVLDSKVMKQVKSD